MITYTKLKKLASRKHVSSMTYNSGQSPEGIRTLDYKGKYKTMRRWDALKTSSSRLCFNKQTLAPLLSSKGSWTWDNFRSKDKRTTAECLMLKLPKEGMCCEQNWEWMAMRRVLISQLCKLIKTKSSVNYHTSFQALKRSAKRELNSILTDLWTKTLKQTSTLAWDRVSIF